MHDAVTIGIPLLAILFGILLNQRGLDKLESRLDSLIDGLEVGLYARIDRMGVDLNARIDRIQADLTRFYQILGEHGGKIELLSKK